MCQRTINDTIQRKGAIATLFSLYGVLQLLNVDQQVLAHRIIKQHRQNEVKFPKERNGLVDI